MATDLDRQTSLQALADSTGLIYDRAVVPEKVIGQCWLISKGRVVTLASAVSNYTEAPWALVIRFPHPDVAYGVRQISLHPDFNKREARDIYLTQAHNAMGYPVFDNDIATVILESDLSPPPPEKIAELNRALSVPFEISPRDMSGAMRGNDLPQILQSAVGTGRSGLVTMVDVRNIPFARVAINKMRITKVMYQNLYNELALCELLWRRPQGNFAFQPIENFPFPPDVPDMQTPAEQVVTEGLRRSEELPQVIEMLGGQNVRFQKATRLADFSSINQQERFVAERLWEALDGYVTLGKIPDRIGADTYGALKMVWDLAQMGLISPSPVNPLHANGQLGPMLVPASDLEVSTWDKLFAFYLDPLCYTPISVDGNFVGPVHVLSNKSLLHTIPLPPSVQGAAVLKDGKLIGIHTGAYHIRNAASSPPPMILNRMMWIGALNDLGAKRLRTAEVAAGEGAEPNADDQTTSQKISGLRTRAMTEAAAQAQMPAESAEEIGPLARFTKKQLAIAAGGSMGLVLIMMIMNLFGGHPGPAPEQTAPTQTGSSTATATSTTPTTGTAPTTATEAGDPAAIKVATDEATLSGTPPATWVYKDTSKITDPRPSFGLQSELKNTDMMFIVWPNISPIANLPQLAKKIPYVGWFQWADKPEFTGSTEHTQWVAGHYVNEKSEQVMCVMGVYPAKDPTKCIIFFARPLSGTGMQDMDLPANVVEGLLVKQTQASASGSASPAAAGTPATAEQLAEYRQKLEAAIKPNYKPPQIEDDRDDNVALAVTIDSKGEVLSLALKPNPNEDMNAAIKKAFEASKPLPLPPTLKNGQYALLIKGKGSQLTVEEQ